MSNDKDEQAVVIFTTIDCPFCGGEASLIEPINGRLRRFYVRCQGCWSQTTSFKRAEEAIAAWNNRSPSPAEAGTDAERLKHIDNYKNALMFLGESYSPDGEIYDEEPYGFLKQAIRDLEVGIQPLPAPPQERTEEDENRHD